MPEVEIFTRYVVVDRSSDPRRAKKPFECRLHREGARPRARFFATAREAERYGAKMLAAKPRSAAAHKPRAFTEVAEGWLEVQRGMDLKPQTITQYESLLRNWVTPSHGRWGLTDMRITSVTGGDIQKLLAEMKHQGRSGSLRKQVFGLIGMICDHALAEGMIELNPQDQVPGSRKPSNKRSRSPMPLDKSQAHAVHDRIAEKRHELHINYALMVLIGFYQGMRFSEIAAIQTRDVAPAGRRLRVANPAKHGDERTSPLLGPLPDLLGSYISRAELSPTDLLFPSLGGRSLPAAKVARAKEMRADGAVLREIAEELDVSISMARTYCRHTTEQVERSTTPVNRAYYRNNLWDPAVQALGLGDRQFRDLRNSCIRALLTGGIDGRRWPPDLVQQFIGHSDSRMTMDVYHQIYDDDVQRFAFGDSTQGLA